MIEFFAALVLAAGSPAAAAAPENPPQAAPAEVATQAPSPEATAPDAAAKAKPKADKVVCHRETELGSHFSRKICVTARTAGERSQDDRDALHDIQDHASSPSYR